MVRQDVNWIELVQDPISGLCNDSAKPPASTTNFLINWIKTALCNKISNDTLG